MRYLLTLLAIILTVAAHAQIDTAALKKKAIAMYVDAEYSETITIVERLMSEDSTRADLYWLRGLCRLNKGETDEGMNDLSVSIALAPNDVFYREMRSQMHSLMLEFDEALIDMQGAYSVLPPYGKATDSLYQNVYGMLGMCYSDVRNFDSAMHYYKKALALDSNNEMAVHSAIIALIEMKDYKRAELYLKKYESMVGEGLEPRYMYVWYYVNIGKYKEALLLAEELLKIEKRPHGVLYSNKAFAHYKLGEYDQALEDINKSLDIDPSNSYAYKNRALIHIALKNATEACNDLRTAINMNYTTRFGNEVKELYVEHCNKM